MKILIMIAMVLLVGACSSSKQEPATETQAPAAEETVQPAADETAPAAEEAVIESETEAQ